MFQQDVHSCTTKLLLASKVKPGCPKIFNNQYKHLFQQDLSSMAKVLGITSQ